MARKSRKQLADVPVQTFESPVYRAGGYIRLSVEDNKKKGDSLETQKSILESYIALSADLQLHDYYIDNGTTGTNFHRPAFQRMLEDAENGVINCIIVKDLSRFGRNAIDTGYYIEKYLPSIKVRFISINDNFDTDHVNPGDGIMLPLKNMINEAYSLDIGRKIKAQQRQSMKEGQFVGARPPYGYLKNPDNCHHLIVDEETAPVVRQIFQWAYEKVSLNDITRRLNEAGILTPSHAKKAAGLIAHENLIGKIAWQTWTISKILSCETYTGTLVQGKTKSICHQQTRAEENNWIRVESTHEALVSREVFDAVQVFRQQVAEEAIQKPKKPYTPNLFKGKIFCGHCGGSLHRQRCERKRGPDVYVFHCLSNSRRLRGSCKPYSLPEKELLFALLTILQKQAETTAGNALILRQKHPDMEVRYAQVKARLAALRQELDRDRRMLKSLYESLVTGILSDEEYREMRAGYGEKIERTSALIQEFTANQKEMEIRITDYIDISNLIAGITGQEDITALLIDRLIDRIQVFSDRHIEVDFRFESGWKQLEKAEHSLYELLADSEGRLNA